MLPISAMTDTFFEPFEKRTVRLIAAKGISFTAIPAPITFTFAEPCSIMSMKYFIHVAVAEM